MAFTYTHKPVEGNGASPVTLERNRDTVIAATRAGMVVNLSGDNPAHADRLLATGAGPVTVVLPRNAPKVSRTPNGTRIVVCPAQTSGAVTCASCGNGRPLCARADRDYVVGFRAHGNGAAATERVAMAV